MGTAGTRRDLIRAGAAGLTYLASASGAGAQSQSPPAFIAATLGDGQAFSPSAVADLARSLAKRAFVPAPSDVPDPFNNLPFERYVGIRAKPGQRIWANDRRGFAVEPLVRGFVFGQAVLLYTVEDETVRRVGFDRAAFDFGQVTLPANLPDPGFSGVRLYDGPDGGFSEFATVQGATFFRAVGRGQTYGVAARALTLKAGDPKGEEFPIFRALWIEKPTPGLGALIVHGLIDSESTTGAVRLTFRPGETTIVDVETTLFPRVAMENVGLGSMNTAFLFGPNVRRTIDDVRPAAYEASGLSMLSGRGEWIWRPLNNPDSLQISAFLDKDPRGFGLLQRERDPAFFMDDVQRFETRPSLWIEPIGDWNAGVVQLIEIPSDAEINRNILAYWRPKAVLAAGSEVAVAYRQFWGWSPPDRPDLAIVAATRSGKGSTGKRRRFLVEFTGDNLAAPIPDLKAAASASPGAVMNVRVWAYPARKTVRVGFELDCGNETACELRLVLQSGPTPLSETWLYRWTP